MKFINNHLDKITHFGYSYAFTLSVALILIKLTSLSNFTAGLISFGLCQLIGICKEAYDETGFDHYDVLANILGGGLATFFISIL